MKTTLKLSGVVLALVSVCTQAEPFTPRTVRPDSGPLAPSIFVNGAPISNGQVDIFTQTLVAGDGDQEKGDLQGRRAAAVRELTVQEALAQEAIARGMDKDIEIADALAYSRREILSRVVIQDFFQNNPVTNDMLETNYELRRTEGKMMEYKVRQILLPTREQAEGVIARLKKGEKFIALTKLSKDPGGSANQGYISRDGWFRPDEFVDFNFAVAVEAQPLGQPSTKPFRTRFGWHVILVEDKRKVEKPAKFKELHASVVEAMTQRLGQQRLNELIKSIAHKAKLTDAQGKVVELDKLGPDGKQ